MIEKRVDAENHTAFLFCKVKSNKMRLIIPKLVGIHNGVRVFIARKETPNEVIASKKPALFKHNHSLTFKK